MPGRAFAMKDRLGYADEGAMVLVDQANDTEMAIPAIISTSGRDRVGDIVEPAGVDLTGYRKNPVVSYGHFQLDAYQTPVGISEDKNGVFEVQIRPRELWARCHFHQHTRQAVEVYLLVKHRIVRGTSIGFDPIGDPEQLPITPRYDGGFRFRRWELLEWAWCAVQANAECAAETRALISRKTLGGERISAVMLKSLEPFAEPLTEYVSVPVDCLLWGDDMARKKALSEGGGMVGGYTVTSELPIDDATGKPSFEDVKKGVYAAMEAHGDHAPLEGPHDAYVQKSSFAAHHVHHKMAHPSHLDNVRTALTEVPGVSNVTQSEHPPDDEGYELVYERGPADTGLGRAEGATLPAGQEPEAAPVAIAKHAKRGMLLKGMVGLLPRKVKSALEECVSRKIPKIADDHPEMAEDQRTAVAYSMCGEKALGLKAFSEEDEEEEQASEGETTEESGGDLASLLADLTGAIVAIQEKIKPKVVAKPQPQHDEVEEEDADPYGDGDNPAIEHYSKPPKSLLPRLVKAMHHKGLAAIHQAADHLHVIAKLPRDTISKAHHKAFDAAHEHARALDALSGAMAHESDQDGGPAAEITGGAAAEGSRESQEPDQIKAEKDDKSLDLDAIMASLEKVDGRVNGIGDKVYAATGDERFRRSK